MGLGYKFFFFFFRSLTRDPSSFTPVSSTLTETRQFYDLYNSLEDQKASMEKEVCPPLSTVGSYASV